ncbi:D-glycero-D-manno-heptose 1-phosphate guanosyltransferase [Hippea maritima]|uniref:Nucleotidyl transferase n=1 Tax=Hippea maritima (strain ATCC 700847 / DSM 10411 / MH2) TaxID=760142 RepID=F2LUP3_HIPMA|nr:nucleotidyltransferase family protein [Hippea maritima]AEA34633.1 Nucleotidyl transferase [Hippea maritima DSM 10411]
MEAIVLAGGLGTRLRSVVSDVPKPMAPINDKPFLEYILEFLNNQNIKKVILSVGYKWEVIKDYFGDKYKDIELVYNIEKEQLGTGGAIKDSLRLTKNDEVYVLNGDTFFDVDLSKMKLDSNLIEIALKEMKDFDRYGVVEIDEDGYIQNFKEKSYYNQGFINGGIYLLKREIFDDFNLPKKFSFEEFLENNFQNLKAKGKVFNSYFIDIGIPEDYEKAKRYFSENFIFR